MYTCHIKDKPLTIGESVGVGELVMMVVEVEGVGG